MVKMVKMVKILYHFYKINKCVLKLKLCNTETQTVHILKLKMT